MENHQKKLDSYFERLSLSKSRESEHNRNESHHKRLTSEEQTSSKAAGSRNTMCPSNVRSGNSKARNIKAAGRLSNIAERLPDEILLKIFGLLRPCDLLVCSCVCQRWTEVAGDNLLWQPLYERFKLFQPGEPDSVYTIHAGIRWKRAFMDRCIQRRNTALKQLLKKKNTYTGLPANTDSFLMRLRATWYVILRDCDDRVHSFCHSDVSYYDTSVTVRWYPREFIPPDKIRGVDFKAEASVLFKRDGSPITDGPRNGSHLLSFPWKAPQVQWDTCSEDDTLNLSLPYPGVIVALWESGGVLAFVLSLPKWGLVERCLLGDNISAYQPKLIRPPADDVDSQYGLHGYTCDVKLRQQQMLWSERFTKIHCPKEKIDGGHVTFTLIHMDTETDHSALTRTLCLPWKTDFSKGIYQDLCILDVTLFDEFSQPFWSVCTPVSVKKVEKGDLSMVYHGEQFLVHYSDCKGHIDATLVRVRDNKYYNWSCYLVTSLILSLKVEAINSWFSTSYS